MPGPELCVHRGRPRPLWYLHIRWFAARQLWRQQPGPSERFDVPDLIRSARHTSPGGQHTHHVSMLRSHFPANVFNSNLLRSNGLQLVSYYPWWRFLTLSTIGLQKLRTVWGFLCLMLIFGGELVYLVNSTQAPSWCAVWQISSVINVGYTTPPKKKERDLVLILFEMTDDWLQHAATAEIWISDFLCGHLSPAPAPLWHLSPTSPQINQ